MRIWISKDTPPEVDGYVWCKSTEEAKKVILEFQHSVVAAMLIAGRNIYNCEIEEICLDQRIDIEEEEEFERFLKSYDDNYSQYYYIVYI